MFLKINVFLLCVHLCFSSEHKIDTKYTKVQQQIVMAHNRYRANVNPPAANMLKMTWNDRAAKEAQKWAEACYYLTHNYYKDNYYWYSGQNIVVSIGLLSWEQVIKIWNDEQQDYTYGSDQNDFHKTGHYTQLVWATTTLVGCGVAICKNNPRSGENWYNYVCNYLPSGNMADELKPYIEGNSCSACPDHCENNLCTNPCPRSDLYPNCVEYIDYAGCPLDECGATCECDTEIYYKRRDVH